MSRVAASTPSVARRVTSASLWVTAGMLVGRLAGVVRELLIADTFGVSRNADIAILLIAGPDLLVTLAGSGAVGLVLIPILLDHDVGEQRWIVWRLTVRLGIASVALAVAAAVVALIWGRGWVLNGGVSAADLRVAVILTAVAVPFSMVVVLTASLLRAQDRFAIVSFSTLTFTVPLLISVVAFRSLVGVGIGLAAGAILRYGAQALAVIRIGQVAPAQPAAWSPGRADLAASFAISVLQASQVFLPLLIVAAMGKPGDVAVLNYGWRVLLIPIGLLGSVFSVAAYPSIVRLLSLQESSNDSARQRPAVRSILRAPVLGSVVIAVWLWVYAMPVGQALYRSTGLKPDALDLISRELRIGAFSLPFIIIGTAATTVMFGLKQRLNGLLPYFASTPIMVAAGSVLMARSGPTGVMFGVLTYAIVLAGVAVLVLWRASGFLMIGSADAVGLVVAAVLGYVVALAVRAVLSGTSLFAVAAGGVIYSIFCITLLVGARRFLASGRGSSVVGRREG